MKLARAAAAAALLALAVAPASGRAQSLFEGPRPSPRASVTQRVGTTDFTLTYSRPSVKGRKVWGDLVPFGKPWRTGANEATLLTVSDDVTVEGQKLAAGTYALVTIPGEAEWTVIFNRDRKLWFETEYDEKQDVLRVKVKPEAAPMAEALQVGFPEITPTTARLTIRWEKLQVPVLIAVDVEKNAMAAARAAVAKAKPDDWQTPLAAARYLFDAKLDRTQAWAWLEKSIAASRNYTNVGRKARVLADEGKLAEAVAAGTEAVELGKKAPEKPNTAALEKAIAEWKAKAK